jgi:hypothetical protein
MEVLKEGVLRALSSSRMILRRPGQDNKTDPWIC